MFTRHLTRAIAASAIALAMAAPASATLLFSNGLATGDSGRCAEDSGACGGAWTVFDDFTLGTNSTITSISWTAHLQGGLADFNGARAWIYSADPVFGSGTLLATVAVQGASPTPNGLGSRFFDLTLSTSIDLTAGTYWLGLQHDTGTDYATVGASSTGTGAAVTQWQNNGTGFRNGNLPSLAFRIDGHELVADVPEPTSLALVGLAMSALVMSRKRRPVKQGDTQV